LAIAQPNRNLEKIDISKIFYTRLLYYMVWCRCWNYGMRSTRTAPHFRLISI